MGDSDTETEWNPLDTVREEIVPRVETLVRMAETLEATDRVEFFREVVKLLGKAGHTDELMEPFMLLSTSAFRGFSMSPPEAFVLDEILEIAGHTSEVLARGDELVH